MITSTAYCLPYALYCIYILDTIHCIHTTYIPLLNAMNDPVVERNEGNGMPVTVNRDGPID